MKRLLLGLLFLVAGISAYADTFTFNFDPLTPTNADRSADVAALLTSQIQAQGCLTCFVTVTGPVAVDQTYTAEGFVVGPSATQPFTLGTTNSTDGPVSDGSTPCPTGNLLAPGNYHSFLANTTDNSLQLSHEFTLNFFGLTSIASASFNYEIFPDGGAEQPPDLIFSTDTGPVFRYFGVLPGTGTSTPGVPGSADFGWTSYNVSANNAIETSAQLLGYWSGDLPASSTSLTFTDWPETIGINNITITTPTPVPEPNSIVLLGSAAAAMLTTLRRKLRR